MRAVRRRSGGASRPLPGLLAALLASACATSPDTAEPAGTNIATMNVVNPDGRSRVYDLRHQAVVGEATVAGSATEVWAVLPDVFGHLELEVNRRDASAAVMGNTGSRVRRLEGERLSRFLDCGRGPTRAFADEYEVTLSVIVQLLGTDGDATTLRTLVDAYARDRTMSGGGIHCISSGILERRIGELVAERLDG